MPHCAFDLMIRDLADSSPVARGPRRITFRICKQPKVARQLIIYHVSYNIILYWYDILIWYDEYLLSTIHNKHQQLNIRKAPTRTLLCVAIYMSVGSALLRPLALADNDGDDELLFNSRYLLETANESCWWKKSNTPSPDSPGGRKYGFKLR